ncbi:DUF1858 domain-containing protein [Thermanaeromonas sp. C210]|uniref:DUF1858 domain-containing protein n=1 Tax=Thermanaeromonas sp. C210 TaxID=2731925 RepID=UPI00155D2458|nr:DUF1858 domain-containing protein [Thermanaeromonas sp. C210]GFN23999.1 hypothetical protein TAMC210_23160 [Thermanaeromonas sp. C210]
MTDSPQKKIIFRRITKDLSIMEVLQAYPEVRPVFSRHGMGCLTCMGAMAETIESGARVHGIKLEELLADLNDAIKNRF